MMDETYLVVETGVESGSDVVRNDEGNAIQVSLPVVGEYDSHKEAEENSGSGTTIVVA